MPYLIRFVTFLPAEKAQEAEDVSSPEACLPGYSTQRFETFSTAIAWINGNVKHPSVPGVRAFFVPSQAE